MMTARESPVVLVVDDQAAMRALCLNALRPDYRVIEAADGQEALRLLYQHRPALVLLDVVMPVMDGFETLQRIREITDCPVILLTGRTADSDVVRGLDGGAQDHVAKPFNPVQLLARVRAAIRDSTPDEATGRGPEGVLSFDEGRLVIDLARRMAIVRGKDVARSAREFGLLELLARHAGQVLTFDQILDGVWGQACAGEAGYVKTYVGLLRNKIEEDPHAPVYLRTRRGFGYVLEARRR